MVAHNEIIIVFVNLFVDEDDHTTEAHAHPFEMGGFTGHGNSSSFHKAVSCIVQSLVLLRYV